MAIPFGATGSKEMRINANLGKKRQGKGPLKATALAKAVGTESLRPRGNKGKPRDPGFRIVAWIGRDKRRR
jgi:hypothetical protein